jgi:hypothetical protein
MREDAGSAIAAAYKAALICNTLNDGKVAPGRRSSVDLQHFK